MRDTALSLQLVQATSSIFSMLAQAQVIVPELHSILFRSRFLMERALDVAADNIYLELKGVERQVHPKTNGKHSIAASRIAQVATESSPAGIVIAVNEEASWEPSSALASSRCKRLLLEILRRASHDWILYRQHRKMVLRELAEDAYTWLFEEEEGHPDWEERKSDVGDSLTSFLSICEALDFDPEDVRNRVRKMNIKTIISAGRPAESRRFHASGDSQLTECELVIDVNVDSDEAEGNYETRYESYGNVLTPSKLSPPEFLPPY